MTSSNHERVLTAGKHLALALAAVASAGCMSNGSSGTGSTAATYSTPAVTSSSPTSTSAAAITATTGSAPATGTTQSAPSGTTYSTSTNSNSGSARVGPGGSTLIFSFPSGLNGATSNFQTAAQALFTNGIVALDSSAFNPHQAGAVWYKQPQDIRSFTTDFTFQLDPAAYGITFCVQNSNSTTSPYGVGDNASADANGLGYAAYNLANQYPIRNSIAIKFDLTAANGGAYLGATPSSTGLYLNGGPFMETGFIPENDLTPFGINLHSGDVMAAHVVYDGSTLTMTLRDTRTNAQTRISWPVNIPAVTGSDYAWVGFTAGTIPNVSQNLLTWSYAQGFDTKLSAPTFNVPPGQYSSSQTITITGPSGATIYYTTNGQSPTLASKQYTGPISVTSTEIVRAVAVESGYTDSDVASAYYQMSPNGTPVIDFPNGFSGASDLISINGDSVINGSSLQLTDTSNYNEIGSAWFSNPVNIENFTTSFILNLTGPANANGLTFTIQNQNVGSTDTNSVVVSGGPTALSMQANGLGYQGMQSSLAIIFDLWDGSRDLTGLYTDGTTPSGQSVDMSSSGVSLRAGNPLAVTISYDGTALTLTVRDTKTDASFSHTWSNVDIPTIVGGNTAYVGFTGATGGMTALQAISSWTFSN